jgi:hypothetical protein
LPARAIGNRWTLLDARRAGLLGGLDRLALGYWPLPGTIIDVIISRRPYWTIGLLWWVVVNIFIDQLTVMLIQEVG